MLKPALARGELHAVGATTLDEYREHIEKDAALERRFQPVYVGEPTVEDTIAILRGLKERYEVHHGVRITDARHRRGGDALGPLHHRPLPAGQGDRPHRRGRAPAAHRDRLDADRDRRDRPPDPPAPDRGGRAREGERRGLGRAARGRARGDGRASPRALGPQGAVDVREGGHRRRPAPQGRARRGAGRRRARRARRRPAARRRDPLRAHPRARARSCEAASGG